MEELLGYPLPSYIGVAPNFNIKENGVYKVDSGTSEDGGPNGAYKFGSLIVYGDDRWFKTMIYITANYSGVYIKLINNGSWQEWSKIENKSL